MTKQKPKKQKAKPVYRWVFKDNLGNLMIDMREKEILTTSKQDKALSILGYRCVKVKIEEV